MSITLIAALSNAGTLGRKILRQQGKIGEVFVDCTHLEEIEFSNTITDHPIEDGAALADHIYKNPVKIKVEGSITESPIDIIQTAGKITEFFSGNILNNAKNMLQGKGQKQLTAYETLKNMRDSRSVFDVVNYLDTFRNMIIENLTFSRDNKTGDRLFFIAELKQISTPSVRTTSFSSRTPKRLKDLASSKIDFGRNDTTTIDPVAIAPKSQGAAAWDWVKSFRGN